MRKTKNETHFFLPGIHQKYSTSSNCVDNRGLRINKHKNLTFQLILTKKFGPIEIRTYQKITFRFISGEPDVKSILYNFFIELFSWQLNKKIVSRYHLWVFRNCHAKGGTL